MATNQVRWVKSLLGEHVTGPLLAPGNFGAGSANAIKRGELLELTGTGNTLWVPMDADFDMSAAAGSGGKVAIAACEIKSGDLAGYYPIVVPRPGDVFEFDLDADDDLALGTALYWSTSEQVTDTAGTNIIGHVAGWTHYPYPQGHAADDASVGRGTTIRTQARVHMTIEVSNSFYSALQNT